MRVRYQTGISAMRGMAGGRARTTHGFAIRPGASQTLNKRTLKGKRASAAEVRGQRAMQIILHSFSTLLANQRAMWHEYRRLIKREWPTRTAWGDETVHHADITYSDLDFFVACNHHRVLCGLRPLQTPVICIDRPGVTTSWVERDVLRPGGVVIQYDKETGDVHDAYLYGQGGIPFPSAQRHHREQDYWCMTADPADALLPLRTRWPHWTVMPARYDIQAGTRWAVRGLLLNLGWCPYAYTTWRGIVADPG